MRQCFYAVLLIGLLLILSGIAEVNCFAIPVKAVKGMFLIDNGYVFSCEYRWKK